MIKTERKDRFGVPILSFKEYDELAESQEVECIDDNGMSSNNVGMHWYTVNYTNGDGEDFYTKSEKDYVKEKEMIKNAIIKMTDNDDLDICKLLSELIYQIGEYETFDFLSTYDNTHSDIGELCHGDYFEVAKRISESPKYNVDKELIVIEDGKFVSLDVFEYTARLLSYKGRIISTYIKYFGIESAIEQIETFTYWKKERNV